MYVLGLRVYKGKPTNPTVRRERIDDAALNTALSASQIDFQGLFCAMLRFGVGFPVAHVRLLPADWLLVGARVQLQLFRDALQHNSGRELGHLETLWPKT